MNSRRSPQKLNSLLLMSFALLFLSCRVEADSKKRLLVGREQKKEFSKYWERGKAEINRYSLEQARYGKTHKGNVVLIFVTEDFLTDKLVKNETYQNKKSTQVLKLNFNRKFLTGVYDYSTMTSVFSPVNIERYQHALKISASSQEWCGHVYSQLTRDDDEYELISHSYFEKEVFENYDLNSALLEDEIMTRIRISPESLPLGKIKVIPSLLDSRLRHYRLSVEEGTAGKFPSKDIVFPGKKLIEYRIHYHTIDRVFRVVYENRFPYAIMGFIEDTPHPSYVNPGSDPRAEKRSHAKKSRAFTKAVRTHSMLSSFWKQNQPKDRVLRKKLGL